MARNCCIAILSLAAFITAINATEKAETPEHVDYEIMLTESLTKNYRKGGRPVRSNKQPVIVYYDLKVNKLEKLVWKDPHLKWNETKYNGTDIVTLAASQIWTPDIMLYNTAEDDNKSPQDTYKAPVNVFSNGTVVWYVPVVWKSTCMVDITWFPVDTQICQLIFASLSYTKSRLRLRFHNEPKDIHASKGHHHVTNGEWEYRGMKVSHEEMHYDCCHEPVEQIIYELKIQRKPMFFLLYMIFPVCAVVFLSLLSFIIPPDTGERIGFGVTILLTMGVYLMVISEDLPKTAHKAPLIGVLYVTLFYIMILAYIASTVTVRLSTKDTKPPKCLLRLARRQKLPSRQGSLNIIRMRKMSGWSLANQMPVPRTNRKRSLNQKPDEEDDGRITWQTPEFNETEQFTTPNEKQNKDEREGYYSLRQDILEGSANAERNNEDWRRIAAYLDELFFWVFLALIILSCGTILLALEIMHS